MKRALLVLLLIAVAVPAFAFKVRRGDRVAILRSEIPDEYRREERVAKSVRTYLQRELRRRGLDAFDAKMTWDDFQRDGIDDADFVVEVVADETDGGQVGGVEVSGRNVGVDVGVVMSRVAATLRLYDGRTMELIDTIDLSRRSSAVMPTAIGVGRDHLALWVTVPFVHYSRYRAAARAVAQDAAEQIAGTID